MAGSFKDFGKLLEENKGYDNSLVACFLIHGIEN